MNVSVGLANHLLQAVDFYYNALKAETGRTAESYTHIKPPKNRQMWTFILVDLSRGKWNLADDLNVSPLVARN